MSNSVRNVGSSRSVDAAARTVPGAVADGNVGDGEFANVLNLARGAALGMGAANRDGGEADGASTGRAAPRDGEGAVGTVSSAAEPPTELANLSPNVDTADVATARDGVPRSEPDATPSKSVHREVAANEADPIPVPIVSPAWPAGANLANGTDRPATLSQHRGDKPGVKKDEATHRVAAILANPVLPGANDASANVDPTHEASGPVARPAMPAPADAGVRAVQPDSGIDSHLSAAPRSDIADRPGAATGRGKSNASADAAAQPVGARFGTGVLVDDDAVSAADFAPPSDPDADATGGFAGKSPALPGATLQDGAPLTSPAFAAGFRQDGAATVDQSAGRVAGPDGTSDSPPDSGDNPTPVIPIDHRGDGNNAAPGQNLATIQPAIVDVATQGATGPAFRDPRTRQTNDNSTIVGASSAAMETTPLNLPAAASGAASGDSGLPGSTPQPFADALANHVLSMASSGHQETTLELQPPQLGDLTVRVAVQGRDVSAWFGAAQPQVQQAVSQALEQLRLGLAAAGFNLTGAWVGADASGAQRQFDTAAAPARRSGFTAAGVERANERDLPQPSSGISVYV